MTKNDNKKNNAFIISKYYGFDTINKFKVDDADIDKGRSLRKGGDYVDKVLRPVEEQVSLFRTCKELEDKKTEYPVLLYQESYPQGSHKKPRLKTGEKNISLHVIGTPKSIAEALLIKTAVSILKEEGINDISLEVNSVGGKESIQQFMKELNAFYRKNINNMNSTCKQLFKDGAHSLITCGNKDIKKMSADSPSSLEFLSEEDRKHFSEVIEFLESQDIPYEVNKDILGDPYYSTHTVFTIINRKNGKIVATGTRCDELAKRSGNTRKDLPSASLTLLLDKPKKAKEVIKKEKYKFCFIQLGNDAKFKGLEVIETLRKAKIPVYQAFGRDKLSSQLEIAKRNKVPYIILMGQKEAMSDSVVVRDTKTHSQTSIPIKDLVSHIKNLMKNLRK